MRHLAQVERDDPTAFRSVFAERRQTIDSSIAYSRRWPPATSGYRSLSIDASAT